MKRKLTQPEPEFPGLFQLCGEVHKEEPAQRKPSQPTPSQCPGCSGTGYVTFGDRSQYVESCKACKPHA